jgi:3-hydroxybutyryl-CoA dehydrogenase
VGIVGAGFMGTGIAESVAKAGIEVVVHEPDGAALERSGKQLDGSLQRAVRAGKLDQDEARQALERVHWEPEIGALSGCELVIEAVYEDPAVKGPVFRSLDALLPDEVIIASNTSSIPIAQLASWTTRPSRVLGLHFFSPVPVMRLVEIVVGLDTSAESVRTAERFAAAIGKTSIRTKDRSGFIVNMLLVPHLMAAVRMFEEGFASREDIDQGMKLGAGHPMGPLTLCDFIGLDVLYAVCDSLYEEFKRPEYAPPPLLKRMVVSGHHGRKSGRGFYEYAA